MKTKENIPAEIASIETLTVVGDPASIPLKLRLLTNLYFNRQLKPSDIPHIMLAIERLVITLDKRSQDSDEVGFERLWSSVEKRFSSVKSVAKTAMRIGYESGKTNLIA